MWYIIVLFSPQTKYYSEDFASVGLRNMLIVDKRKQWSATINFFFVSIVFHSIPLLCCDAVLHSILSLCFIPGVCLVASFPTLLTLSSRISDTAI